MNRISAETAAALDAAFAKAVTAAKAITAACNDLVRLKDGTYAHPACIDLYNETIATGLDRGYDCHDSHCSLSENYDSE